MQNFIGIDVSKPWFDASLLTIKSGQKLPLKTEQFENNTKGIKSFEKWLKALQVSFDKKTLMVIENTGIYHRHLWTFSTERNIPLYIGNAADIKWSFGIARGKNDKIDSKRLCDYASKHYETIKPTPHLDKRLLLLKDLMTSRSKLIAQKNAIKTHLKELKEVSDSAVNKIMQSAHKTALDGLDKSIKAIESEMTRIVQDTPSILANYNLLKTVPGIGHIIAIYLICCTYNFSIKISGKQLACYAGVVPFEHSSGISIKGRHRVHRMANKDLKKLLHLAALSVIRYCPEFKAYYERKKAEGKHSMTVLNAIRNKIVLRVVAVVNSRKPYMDKTLLAA